MFSDGQGCLLYSGAERPGRMHDQTAVRTEGIAEQFRTRPDVKAKVDSGYQGLAKEFPDQVTAPPRKPKDDACDATSTPGTRRGDGSPRPGAASSTPPPSCGSGPR
ncbi:hypothetical protein ACIGBL_34295 [Streptomyces sp. NPDC085614]|uniref:hypothetical protein n=1 Tax=Streptomyces sp. NPDC085614 TaxID=3365733 RepID=UPI0037D2E3FB